MNLRYDLHCHSTASDGALTPSELVKRAKAKNVTALALTDHDTLKGQQEAKIAAENNQINYISGIELSTTWERKCFHIVGLNFDLEAVALSSGIEKLQIQRKQRAERISALLEKKGISGAYQFVTEQAGEGMITRSHFADFLFQHQHVKSRQDAFDKYLGAGKSAFVNTIWADLHDAVGWIQAAGGVAVVAHPLRYKLTASWMRRFLAAFKESGGQAIEVVTGRSSVEDIRVSMNYAKKFELTASLGSDFHVPDQWVELGRLAPLPENIQPVWELF